MAKCEAHCKIQSMSILSTCYLRNLAVQFLETEIGRLAMKSMINALQVSTWSSTTVSAEEWLL